VGRNSAGRDSRNVTKMNIELTTPAVYFVSSRFAKFPRYAMNVYHNSPPQ
jgi:hypothetical protein